MCVIYTGGKRLITRMAIQQFLDVGTEWRNRTWSGRHNQSFQFDYRVRCLPDYYGDGCDKYCRGRDDKFGHYICGEGGEVQCLDGWTGVYCEKRKFIILFVFCFFLILTSVLLSSFSSFFPSLTVKLIMLSFFFPGH